MTNETAIHSALHCFYMFENVEEDSRHEKSESTLSYARFDNFLAILEQTLPEIQAEPLPAGMMCPIRGVCPERGRKTACLLTTNSA